MYYNVYNNYISSINGRSGQIINEPHGQTYFFFGKTLEHTKTTRI